MGKIIFDDKNYPDLLKSIGASAPKQLYYKGVWQPAIFEKCLAVVGSRQITYYGKRAVDKIVGPVAASGITIVSGFMYGVDAAAHQAALRAGGRTIAVMPCGIDVIHPAYQTKLYNQILQNKGLIISEYEGNFQPAVWTYPQRNRLVAGLASAVLIVEAALKSGSLITADLAKKFRRKVLVVPGPINSHNARGIIRLLRQGAYPVESAKDILELYGQTKILSSSAKPAEPVCSNQLEEKVLQCLKKEALSLDELVEALSVPVDKLNSLLSLMQLKNLVEEKGNKYYPADRL